MTGSGLCKNKLYHVVRMPWANGPLPAPCDDKQSLLLPMLWRKAVFAAGGVCGETPSFEKFRDVSVQHASRPVAYPILRAERQFEL